MTKQEVKDNWVKTAKWGRKFFGITVLFPAFMFKKRKEHIWNTQWKLRYRVYKNAFINNQITIYQYREWVEDEYSRQ